MDQCAYTENALKRCFPSNSETGRAAKRRKTGSKNTSKMYFRLKKLFPCIVPIDVTKKPTPHELTKMRDGARECFNNDNQREKAWKHLQALGIDSAYEPLFVSSIYTSDAYSKVVQKFNSLTRSAPHGRGPEVMLRALITFLGKTDVLTCDDLSSIGNISPEQAAEFCMIGAARRLAILRCTGFEYNARSFNAARASLSTAKVQFDTILIDNPSWKTKMKFRDYLFVHTYIQNFATITGPELMTLLFDPKVTEKRATYLLVDHELSSLGRSDVVGYLRGVLPMMYTGVRIEHRFGIKSEWHAKLIQSVITFEDEASAHRTSYKDVNSAQRNTGISSCLNFIEDCAGDQGISLKGFLQQAELKDVEDVITAYGKSREVMNHRVKSRKNEHHARPAVNLMTRYFKGGLSDYLPLFDTATINVSRIIKRIPNKRVPLDEETRREYTDEEMDRMLLVCDTYKKQLIFTLLREIGLRVGAIAYMKYYSLVNVDHMPKLECNVPEKQKARRVFETSANLQKRIKVYVDHFREIHNLGDYTSVYLFNARDPTKPVGTDSIRQMMRGIAKDAGITDIIVHPHAFRHTIVGKLIEVGNSMELVSKFMGHKNVQTTASTYWVSTISKIMKMMINPFMESYTPVDTNETREIEDLQRDKIEGALSILHKYNTIIANCARHGQTADDVRKAVMAIPNLQDHLNTIAASVGGDDSCVDSDMDSDVDSYSGSDVNENVDSYVDS